MKYLQKLVPKEGRNSLFYELKVVKEVYVDVMVSNIITCIHREYYPGQY